MEGLWFDLGNGWPLATTTLKPATSVLGGDRAAAPSSEWPPVEYLSGTLI